ncbi:MAG: hypothetical protein ACRDK3_09245, partial [Actinomycetota bacterium]
GRQALIYEELVSEGFDPGSVPAGFTYLEVHGSRPPNEEGTKTGIVYATFSGPGDRNRISYEVFLDEHESRRSFDEMASTLEEGGMSPADTVPQPPLADSPSFCIFRMGLGTSCTSVVGSVIVSGESFLSRDGRIVGDRASAVTLLGAGIHHLESLDV